MPTATIGDLNVAYDVTGTGEPVLMLNGIGTPRAGWGSQVSAFAERHQVITLDNRDVGGTGAGTIAEYTTDQFAHDAAGLLDHLGIDRAHVVGASMGGCIAQAFATLYPERTVTATIICSWGAVDPWMDELWDQWEGLFRDRGPVEWARTTWLWVFTHRAYAEPGFFDGLLAGAKADPNPQTLEMYLRQSRAARTHNLLDRLGSITAPSHVICGDEDFFTPVRYSVDIANAIPGATLSVMEEVGHGMFWEKTDDFNRLILDFLAAHPIA